MKDEPREATFLRPSEAAELTGLSTRAIYRAIERGELRAARLCSRLRIPRAAFHEWIERCAVRPAEPSATTYPPVPLSATGSFRSLLAHREEKTS
jgi:excisionase family DNA binding protein